MVKQGSGKKVRCTRLGSATRRILNQAPAGLVAITVAIVTMQAPSQAQELSRAERVELAYAEAAAADAAAAEAAAADAAAANAAAANSASITPAEIDDELAEDLDRAAIIALQVTHYGANVTSFVADPLTSLIADAVGLAAELALKAIRAPLETPGDKDFDPSEPFTDPESGRVDQDCQYEFTLPQSVYNYEDIFGVNIGNVLAGRGPLIGIVDDWGALGSPDLYHYNSQVILSVSNSYITPSDESQLVSLPAGTHTMTWQTDTMIDIVLDAALPTALLAASAYGQFKRGEFTLSQPDQVEALADAYRKNRDASKGLFERFALRVRDACETRPEKCAANFYDYFGGPLAGALTDWETVSATRTEEQIVTVYDLHDPTITVHTPELVIEATDFGGTFLDRVRDQIDPTVSAFDDCGRSVSLGNDLPVLLPIGPNDVTWTATDLGPNRDGGRNTDEAITRIIVEDTQPPIIVPPVARVIEVDPNDFDPSDGIDAEGVNPAAVFLGVPRVVDLADPNPIISSTAPEFFPVDTRTEVTWSATDKGYPEPNTSTATQLITVKTLGTNTAPTVNNLSATTLTSEPIDIRLEGFDSDVLGGRVDPVAMAIFDRPDNGEFVAPLLPYFIEDFRTSPEGPYGDDFYLASPRGNWLYDNVCQELSGPSNEKIRRDWVYVPRFVEVTDDGTYFMIDSYWFCQPSNAQTDPRISKWDRNGNYLGQVDYNGTTDAFVMDQDGFIYTITKSNAGSSTKLSLGQIKPTFDTDSDYNRDLWIFDFNSTGDDPVQNESYSYARVDSTRGLVYVNDRRRIFVYDVRADLADPERNSRNGMGDLYMGALKNGEVVFACTSFSSSWSGFAMEVDSEGNLYVADTCGDRIHKFGASGFDEEGNFVPGDYVGWMGRCDTSTNKSCDEETGTTKGYSCTDETCTVSTTAGSEPGQFSTPVYLAADPNDILYVADSSNSRIQRFATDGSFAGQAQSTGTGINQGSNPSFVLGNMGNPKHVSVNSTQFFVVDQEESFINVFETTPLKDIDDTGATVTYVSNFDFHSGSDSFTYRANDGLVDSNTGTVTIQVNRNFRPPTVEAQSLTTEEDVSVNVTLLGDDPDGIAGEDFNGLDTLSWEVVDQPAHGILTGVAPNLVYNPDPDFFGTDSFTYTANDGVFDSEAGEVTVEVTPVDDAVRFVEVKWPERVGRGFPTLLMADWIDDGSARHDAWVFWGDGAFEFTGDFVDPDGEEGPEPPVLEGVKIVSPPGGDGEGMNLADHIYEQAGNFAIEHCVAGQVAQTCEETIVSVQELASFSVQMEPENPETGAGAFELSANITNVVPMGWAGLSAEDIQLDLLAEDYRVLGFSDNSGNANCALVDAGLQCSPQDLAPGESIALDITVEPMAPPIYENQVATVILDLVTSTPATSDNFVGTYPVQFNVDNGDDDGDGMNNSFERYYGLDPASAADASADSDGDGLTNLEEFEAMTDPTDADTDGDGVNDSLDPYPLDPTRSGDFDATDLNLDGVTDALDILLLQQALRGEFEADLDLNNDGLMNAADLLLLQLLVQGDQ